MHFHVTNFTFGYIGQTIRVNLDEIVSNAQICNPDQLDFIVTFPNPYLSLSITSFLPFIRSCPRLL